VSPNWRHGQIRSVGGWRCRYDLQKGTFDVPSEFKEHNARPLCRPDRRVAIKAPVSPAVTSASIQERKAAEDWRRLGHKGGSRATEAPTKDPPETALGEMGLPVLRHMASPDPASAALSI
jgi:hypothetical protein